jgi:hypothetical protein
MSKTPINPFETDDLVATLARESSSIQAKQAEALNTFLVQNQSTASQNQNTLSFQTRSGIQNHEQNTTKPNFNLSQYMPFNLTHFTKLSFAVLTIFSTLTIVTGTVAAQAIAPDNLKPSNIVKSIKEQFYSINKQKDQNPYTAIKPDNENYIVYLRDCDLGLKYPKTVNGNEFYFNKSLSNRGNSYNLISKNNDEKISARANFQIDFKCAATNSINNTSNIGTINYVLNEYKTQSEIKLTNNELRQRTGWFIANDVKNIKYISKLGTNGINNFDYYSFEHGTNTYIVSIKSQETKTNFDYTNLQLQFGFQLTNDSLVKSTILEEIPTINSEITKQIKINHNELLNYIETNEDYLSSYEINNEIYGKDKTEEIINPNQAYYLIQIREPEFYNFRLSPNEKNVKIEELNYNLISKKIIGLVEEDSIKIAEDRQNDRSIYQFIAKLRNTNQTISIEAYNVEIIKQFFQIDLN